MKLAHDDAGAGPCVVLLHGHPFDRSLWRPQLEPLAAEFRVLAPDLRGFGESRMPAPEVTMEDYARDLEQLLDDSGAGFAAVVGLSMGGLVAMHFATTRPDRCWAVGLVATTAQPPSGAEREARLERAALIERAGMQPLIEYMRSLYGPRCPRDVQAEIDAMMARAPVAGAAAALRARAARPDYRPALERLDLPAFVCVGTADPWSDEPVTREIVEHLRHPELTVLPDVGHLPNREAPDAFNAALLAFLRAHRPRDAT